MTLRVIDAKAQPNDVLVHDETSRVLAQLLLGMNAIRAFKKVSIDFANRKFRVVLPEHSSLDARLASVGRE